MTDDERRHFDNLILLCPNCHVRIDDLEPDAHPPERLLEMKEKALRAAQRRDAWAHDVLLERFAEQAVRILRQSAELGQSGEFHLELGDRPIASFRGQSEVPREDERSDVGRLLTEAGDLLVTEDGDPLALEHESNPQPVKKTDSTPSEWAITSTDAQPIQTFTPESSAGHGPASARLASDEGARRVGDLDEDDYDGNDVNLTSTAQPRTASQTDRHPT